MYKRQQQAASEVAERAGTMAGIMQQRVLGVVENMSWLEVTAPKSHETFRVDLFGTGGGQKAADALSERLGTTIPLLGQIPLDVELRSGGDDGDPIVIAHPDSPAAKAITELARSIDARPRGLTGINLRVQPISH